MSSLKNNNKVVITGLFFLKLTVLQISKTISSDSKQYLEIEGGREEMSCNCWREGGNVLQLLEGGRKYLAIAGGREEMSCNCWRAEGNVLQLLEGGRKYLALDGGRKGMPSNRWWKEGNT